VVLGSSNAAPSNVAIQGAKKDTKGGKKRQNWRPQWVTDAVDYNDNNNNKVNNSGMECVATTGRSVKHQTQPLTDHFERLLEEACPNHAYPIKHNLKDYDMMKNFMISGFLTRDKEPDEDPSKRDTLPFPREDAAMTVYDGHLPLERRRMSNSLRLGTWGHMGVKETTCRLV
jgi:hypothetical protein